MHDFDFTPALAAAASGGPVTARERALVAAEREACAKLAETPGLMVPIDFPVDGLTRAHEPTQRGIAAAIRNRS